MRVLHICRDFVGSKVHSELYKQLDQIGIEQVIYCCYRDKTKSQVGNNYFRTDNTKILYRPILKLYHRILFLLKTRTTVKDLEECVDLSTIDLIHATTIFTDGAVACTISKKYKIPFIVAARNTDYNDFIKHAPHLLFVHRKVISNAKKVVFITQRLRSKFLNHYSLIDMKREIYHKSIIQANGINDFWLDNTYSSHSSNHTILYVGNFEPTKNVKRLIKATLKLKESFPDIKLHIIGGGGWDHEAVVSLIQKHSDTIDYHGKIYDKQILIQFYKKCAVFAMPSIHETFGLVYIEALSQGMRVLFSKNEGIDGVFNKNIGEVVNPLSISDISDALKRLLNDSNNYHSLTKCDLEKFRWKTIAYRYAEIYKGILNATN